MANIHVWDRTMEEEELRQKTSCSQTVEDQGSLVNHRCVDICRLSYLHIYLTTYLHRSEWKFTGKLVRSIDVAASEARCDRNTVKVPCKILCQ